MLHRTEPLFIPAVSTVLNSFSKYIKINGRANILLFLRSASRQMWEGCAPLLSQCCSSREWTVTAFADSEMPRLVARWTQKGSFSRSCSFILPKQMEEFTWRLTWGLGVTFHKQVEHCSPPNLKSEMLKSASMTQKFHTWPLWQVVGKTQKS